MNTKLLNRVQYIDSVAKIDHKQSSEFAQQAMEYWDDFYSWENSPCLCLQDKGEDVCYLFYSITKNQKYLFIHNILTPNIHRFNGYAKKLLTILFNEILVFSYIERVKMYCVTSSLKFYMKLGIDFWGVNHLNQFYTNFPMPSKGIDEIPSLMKKEHLEDLNKKELTQIYEKLKKNGSELNEKESKIYDRCLDTLGDRYRFKELTQILKHL